MRHCACRQGIAYSSSPHKAAQSILIMLPTPYNNFVDSKIPDWFAFLQGRLDCRALAKPDSLNQPIGTAVSPANAEARCAFPFVMARISYLKSMDSKSRKIPKKKNE